MAITNAQQARQMYKEGGRPMKKIKGQNHMLAYITPNEAEKLKALGGQETMTKEGIPAYPEFDNYTEVGGGSRSEFEGGAYSGTGSAGDGVIQKYDDQFAQLAKEEARKKELERLELERIKREVEKINKNIEAKSKQKKKIKDFKDLSELENEQDLMDTQLGATGKELSDLKTFDKNKDGKIGPLEGLDRFRTNMAKDILTKSAAQKLGMMEKTLVPSIFMSDMMRKTPKGVTTKGLDEILGVEGRDKKTGVGSMTNPFEVDYTMSQYGLGGKDLTRARQQIDVAMQDKISQDDFDRVYGKNPPPKDDGPGPQLPILPITQPIEDPKEDEEEDFQLALAFRKDGGRVPYADGGIMDLENAQRELYFIGGLVKKAKRAVKKIVKSPIGKIGLGALAFKFGAPLLQGSSFMKNFGFNAIKNKIGEASFGKLAGLSIGGGLLAGALAGKGYQDEDGDGFDDKTGFSVEEYRQKGAKGDVPIAFRADGGMSDVENDPQYKGWKRVFEVNPEAAEMHPKHREFVKYYQNTERQGKEEGGLMNLKGMEMDFREDGGFVPIGKKERADDVPARLSKNEFVMTADAVRGAGDGNIDKGAQKMYNLMDKLEAENDQPQGLDGARKMFQTSQRLEEVL